ncbi:acyl-CoA thioesterase [Nonomuraea sp. NBC_00507]|uniref:acyl-CoA thioesterase n=1 Tax=Nonomuraea sp. NBC_00507 TaxID=2976002 RepID=UPI002E186B11
MISPSHGHIAPVRVHFDELDPMGMLHHSHYILLFDRAISAYWNEHGWDTDPAKAAFKEVILVVRDLNITYHVPITGVSEPLVHFWLEKIGRSSVIYGFRVLSSDQAVVHAEGRRVNVNLDPATFTPAPISAEAREAAIALLGVPAQA